jgi:hypothetical protein
MNVLNDLHQKQEPGTDVATNRIAYSWHFFQLVVAYHLFHTAEPGSRVYSKMHLGLRPPLTLPTT